MFHYFPTRNALLIDALFSNGNTNFTYQQMAENKQTQAEFLENFDWNKYQEGIDSVQEDQLKNFEELVKNNFVDTQDNEVVEGVVTRITDREAIIDINAKSEGVISLNEFRYNPNLKVGDKVEVLIDIREDKMDS